MLVIKPTVILIIYLIGIPLSWVIIALANDNKKIIEKGADKIPFLACFGSIITIICIIIYTIVIYGLEIKDPSFKFKKKNHEET